MSLLRPLAVVMVADPTPLTLANLAALAKWCDLLLTEGTTTTSGEKREPLRQAWRQLLGLEPPGLRVFTTELAGANTWRRQAIQRNGALPVLFNEPDERPILLLDADEFLDAEAVLALIESGLESPVRLGLVPLYGAVDRVAPRIHCCWKAEWTDLRQAQPKREYIFAGGSLATAGMMRNTSPTAIRFRSPLVGRERTYGMHVTMAEPVDQVAWKLRNMRHIWDPRVYDQQHLATMLTAGVHHAGWWLTNYRKPEPWLLELATQAGLRVAGTPSPPLHLRALRAWAEARLDPSVPAMLVAAGDAYVATRAADADDFLLKLNDWLMSRPIEFTGHAPEDSGILDHASGDE
jgi:hypothetical protein